MLLKVNKAINLKHIFSDAISISIMGLNFKNLFPMATMIS